MTRSEIKKYIDNLDQKNLSLFVAKVAHMLTILARDTYSGDGINVADPVRLRMFNESSHRLISATIYIIEGVNQEVVLETLLNLYPESVDTPLKKEINYAYKEVIRNK
jgi:hypothetical protein